MTLLFYVLGNLFFFYNLRKLMDFKDESFSDDWCWKKWYEVIICFLYCIAGAVMIVAAFIDYIS